MLLDQVGSKVGQRQKGNVHCARPKVGTLVGLKHVVNLGPFAMMMAPVCPIRTELDKQAVRARKGLCGQGKGGEARCGCFEIVVAV